MPVATALHHTTSIAPKPLPAALPPKAPAKTSLLEKIQPFIIGGLSGMFSTCIIQPIDMIKVQIQVRSEKQGGKAVSAFGVLSQLKQEGKSFAYLYKGLDSALIRQITYTTTRLGIYKTLFERHKSQHGDVSMAYKSLYGLTAGFIGSLVGNPADLILIRLQSDANLPPDRRRNYRNFGDAFSRIIKEEGVLSLWRGSGPTIVRAMVLNLGMLGPFDEVKERLNRWNGKKDCLQNRLCASAVAGFLCSFFSLPFDNAKTKMQKMVRLPDGTLPYANFVDCLLKTVKTSGVTSLWVGFPTYYLRIAPHAMITLVTQDYLTDFAKRMKNKK